MVNTNQDALGIIFPNSYDNQVPELVSERLMASIPFASRYRMIDFLLSSMVNCGIDNISVIVRKNYRSLMSPGFRPGMGPDPQTWRSEYCPPFRRENR